MLERFLDNGAICTSEAIHNDNGNVLFAYVDLKSAGCYKRKIVTNLLNTVTSKFMFKFLDVY